MKKVPLRSWDGQEDAESRRQLLALERKLGKGHLGFNSVQNALQAVLEALGTTASPVPVVMPITAPPDSFAAVLRSGAQPIMMDIDRDTLELSVNAVEMATTELESCVFLVNSPTGHQNLPLDEALAEQVVIWDSRIPQSCAPEYVAFEVLDMTDIAGSGAVVCHHYLDQLKVIQQVREGVGGLSAVMPEPVAALCEERLSLDLSKREEVWDAYEEHLGDVILGEPKSTQPLLVYVSDMRKALVHLNSFGIKAQQGVFPLHQLDEVSRRLAGDPDYSVAEDLMNHVVALPCHPTVDVQEVCSLLQEVL